MSSYGWAGLQHPLSQLILVLLPDLKFMNSTLWAVSTISSITKLPAAAFSFRANSTSRRRSSLETPGLVQASIWACST
jgi:hypothetical protein